MKLTNEPHKLRIEEEEKKNGKEKERIDELMKKFNLAISKFERIQCPIQRNHCQFTPNSFFINFSENMDANVVLYMHDGIFCCHPSKT